MPKPDEVLQAVRESLARLKEKRYYTLKEFDRRKFNINQDCRAKLVELEQGRQQRQIRRQLAHREANAAIATPGETEAGSRGIEPG